MNRGIEIFAKVIVDAPGLPALDYSVPDDMDIAVGDRVVVGLRTRTVVGIVIEIHSDSDYQGPRIRKIRRVLKDVAPLRADWLALTGFAAKYYIRAWGETAVPTLPIFFRKVPGVRYESQLTKIRSIKGQSSSKQPMKPTLNQEQQKVVRSILESKGFSPFLLFGVTGSGKTEVYLHVIEHVLSSDPEGQVLLMVPEINLTPQLEARVRERFPTELVVSMNSEYTDIKRAKSWLAIHEGKARILVGTRMSVFASFKKLSLVIVDEEHDQSFKAGDGIRYSARDLGIWRAAFGKIPVVLGSATPSIESWVAAKKGRYQLLELKRRAINKSMLPEVFLYAPPERGSKVALSKETVTSINETLNEGRQVLVFLNRRGYSPVLFCPSCGWVSSCSRCSTFAVFHKGIKRLVCHHCGWQAEVPEACPICGNIDILPKGVGTERLEEELDETFPQRRILRIDRDSVSRKDEAKKAFKKVHDGEIDILMGTQIIAKGHDFKNIGLVVVLNVDGQILSSEPRAKEHLFSTLMQVAGRAGRHGNRGKVIIQTRFPTEPIFAALEKQDYVMFTESLVAERRENWSIPFVHQALVTVQAKTIAEALYFLNSVVKDAYVLAGEKVRVYDPVPMSLMKFKDMERAQLLIESDDRASLNRFLWEWQGTFNAPRNISWTIEVDPISV